MDYSVTEIFLEAFGLLSWSGASGSHNDACRRFRKAPGGDRHEKSNHDAATVFTKLNFTRVAIVFALSAISEIK